MTAVPRPPIDRFVARFSEQETDWPWIVRGVDGGKLPHRGAWEVLDVARGVVVKRGLSEDRAREAARFFCPGAPPIDHFAPDGYAIAIEMRQAGAPDLFDAERGTPPPKNGRKRRRKS